MSHEATYDESLVPLLDLLLGEVRVLFEELEVLLGQFRFAALQSHAGLR